MTVRPSDPPLRSVALARGVASYTDEGTGRPLVAVHGLPGSARDFRWLAPHLREHLRFLRIELPGFGSTAVAAGPDPSPRGRARFLLEALDALELERPVLLGHSMGGVVACAAVGLAPRRCAGLGLLSCPGLRRHLMLRLLPVRLARRLLGEAPGRPWRWLQRQLFALAGFRRYPDHELTRTIHCLAATSIEAHALRVRDLRVPTLVGYCEDDPLIEADIYRALAAACPPGPRLIFPEGGHNPQKTHAAAVAEALRDWVATL